MFGSGLVSTRDGAVAFSANSIPLLDQLVAIQSNVCFAARLVGGKDLEVENERFVIGGAKAALARYAERCLSVLSIELEHDRLHVIERRRALVWAVCCRREHCGCGEGRQQGDSVLERSAHGRREDIPAQWRAVAGTGKI